MILWNPARFKAIGNHLGEFIAADMTYKISNRMSVARMLVRMDFRKGFPAEMGIETEWGIITQKLDYEGIPFKCHRCHSYGHVVADCTMTPRFIHIEELDEDQVEPQQVTSQEAQKKVSSEKEAEPTILAEVPSGSKGIGSTGEGLPSSIGPVLSPRSIAQETNSGKPSSYVPVSPVGGGIFGEGLPSTKGSAHISPTIALGNIAGKSSTVLPASSIVSSSLISSNVSIETSRLSSLIIPRVDSLSCPITYPPWIEPPSRIATVSSSQGKGGDSQEESIVRYSLRSREIIDTGCAMIGGLGNIAGISGRGKGRGRKSFISKAQLRASLDIAAGRQSSIEWALRA